MYKRLLESTLNNFPLLRFISRNLSEFSKKSARIKLATLIILISVIITPFSIAYQNTTPFLNQSNLTQTSGSLEIVNINSTLEENPSFLSQLNKTGNFSGVGEENKSNVNISVDFNQTSLFEETQVGKAVLDIAVENPRRVTRGEEVVSRAIVTNVGSSEAKNVVIKWQLPREFEVLFGSSVKNCGSLEVNGSCFSEIVFQPSLSSHLGENEIKVVVNYGG